MTVFSAQNAKDIASSRYTCKAYDPNKPLNDDTIKQLLETLRLSPSSINIQPWRFLVADNATAKVKICQSMIGNGEHNVAKVMNASHVLVLCTKTSLDTRHLDNVLHAEHKAGRFSSNEAMTARKQHCMTYLQPLQQDPKKLFIWSEQQTFIALGHFLFAAQIAGVAATPIGGFNVQILNDILHLADRHLTSSVIVALGYPSKDEPNQHLPKARLDADQVIEFI
ncbi:oxygen-insensitive NAD(P)H nitroreductase [Moraxella nasovis]|uniref:oxygen-insensitive NAD(P)H nitroreductase n=1 Tax=Moraxella nasovis TaxID=2904121 RepID=UPI001F6153B2|nr:oxygen-insensitive NAD(P)H nitroreductase [Moraxella nasovis]UNU73447.1 oxygen-insensitive NAD(P)H nitroreductase [Moraxella nasovis]